MLLSMSADVLVVEDEEDIAVPLIHTLEREGYIVVRAANPGTAFIRFKSSGVTLAWLRATRECSGSWRTCGGS